MADAPSAAVVPVKSPWTSKINWTQVISAGAVMLTISTGGKVSLSTADQLSVVAAITVLTNVVTIVMKTYFTKSVTAASIAP